MSKEDDVKLIIEQEKALVFPQFDELVAFQLGVALRDMAIEGGYSIAVDVRTWDRPMFYMALPGTTGDNQNWIRRKANLVRTVMKSSYRVVLERKEEEDYFLPRRGFDNMEMVMAGGAFPIKVKGAGMIGAVTASGLHERDDHRVVVEAICTYLNLDRKAFRLPAA